MLITSTMPKNYKINAQASMNKDSPTDDTGLCVVCYRKAEIFGIGECDHPVCYECSTRMRVLCGKTECPICRKDMAMVVFTHWVEQFKNIQYQNMKCERRYSIYFTDDSIMNSYDALLDHTCSNCSEVQSFKNFNILKDHMRKFHEMYYCDLCVENLKIFTKERRCYTRSLLAQHRRIGDTDDKSHKGHPLCEFCDSRFMDSDELFRHLRRDHFFCHFCDADGTHFYYEDYDALREHFRSGHFLCEEGNCIDERFTSVFRTKLDLQVHTTQNHGHTMSKTEARQARTVDIAFTLNHRQGHFSDRGRGGRRGEGRGRRQTQDNEEQNSAASAVPPSEVELSRQAIDINCVQDFPSLHGSGAAPSAVENDGININSNNSSSSGISNSIAHKLAQQNRFTIRASRGGALNEEEFPSLGSTTSLSLSNTLSSTKPSNSNPSTSLHFSVNTKKNGHFGAQASTGHNVSIQYNCTKSSPAVSYLDSNTSAVGKIKPRIGNVSHSENITVKSTSTGTKPKSTLMEDDFPLLQPSLQPQQPTSASWVTHSASSSLMKGPKKPVGNSGKNVKLLNDKNTTTTNNNNSNSNCNNNNNDNLSNKYHFESTDFPSLSPSSGKLEEKLNYSGRSSLKIPMKKPLQTKEMKENDIENEENIGSKGKKKKKSVINKGNVIENKNSHTAMPPKFPKKKPLILNNAFDNMDLDEPAEDFSMKREGDYEAVAPVMSSNIRFITSTDPPKCNSIKKSELQIGTLQAPDISSEEFPSLGLGGISTKVSKKVVNSLKRNVDPVYNSNWNPGIQASKKHPPVPPGFRNKNNAEISPGFVNTQMTFTSSSGHQTAISPSCEVPPKGLSVATKTSKEKKKVAKPPEFLLPPNFEKRNNSLIDAIHAGCDGDADKFNKFKHLSGIFRGGQVKGQQYYERCKQIMGKNTFHNILPELLALLPDIQKQQAVFEAYRKIDGGQGCEACFAVCAVCQQVLISDDFALHMTRHEFPSQDYPSLETAAPSHHSRK